MKHLELKGPNVKTLLVMSLIIGALALVACGGSSDDSTEPASSETTSQPGPGGGMFADLSDEDIQCLEDQGVTLPEAPEGTPEGMPEGAEPPEGAPQGTPPEGMPEGGPPEGMPEGMEDLQSAMSACGVEMPTPPEGADAPPVDSQGT